VSQNFERHVYAVQHYVALTNARYESLLDRQIVCHPICCFGDLEKARAITVGLNPSKGEFAPRDRWPASITHNELASRFLEYFTRGNSHQWFEPWSKALVHLNLSYTDGSAAHLDLSPRATTFVSDLKNASEKNLFLDMVKSDLWTFFGTLRHCPKAKLILVAGSVTGKYYINEFLQRFAPDYGYSLDGRFNRSEHVGNGKTAFHTLSGADRTFPVFFCSTSPSARDTQVLPQRVAEHAERLMEHLRV
jgi:hypothetical protein